MYTEKRRGKKEEKNLEKPILIEIRGKVGWGPPKIIIRKTKSETRGKKSPSYYPPPPKKGGGVGG